jgi:cathepsin A (carboxypeptidase C)
MKCGTYLWAWLAILGMAAAASPFPADEKPINGYIDVGRGKLFYWLFKPRHETANTPLIMWLTGGPGCSSSVALFYENGPYQINSDLTLKKNPYSWNEEAYLLFMDQPAGTGFSTMNGISYVVNEYQIAVDMHTFLKSFFKMQEYEKLKTLPFFVTGESYAGHYIPAIGAYLAKNAPDIKLAGLAIGNGLVSPFYQYPMYSDFAYEHKELNIVTYALTKAAFYVCQALIYTNLWPIAMLECQLDLTTILGIGFMPFFNPYDITKPCEKPPLCYDFERVDKFLAREDVRHEIGVGNTAYEDCNMIVHQFLLGDWWFDFTKEVKEVLEHKIPVMVYSGDLDFICNWRGGEAWVHNFDWFGKEQFNKQNYRNWSVNNEVGGQIKKFDKFSFVRVYNAGHMVPMDKPVFALDMINRFIHNNLP